MLNLFSFPSCGRLHRRPYLHHQRHRSQIGTGDTTPAQGTYAPCSAERKAHQWLPVAIVDGMAGLGGSGISRTAEWNTG